ncbi:MAG: dethiobiotin synthase [Proteobacteria bacterium]|nr:dethiobiotin synthase [Pseudomonadota bacterium]
MSYFVTGTDTNVGKTLISCALLHGFAAQGCRMAGFKPVAAGGSLRSNGDTPDVPLAGTAAWFYEDHNEDALRLRAAGNIQATYGQVNPYCFVQEVAPHLAAKFAGVRINLERIVESFRELATLADSVIVEGAGGFCVPLNDDQDGADLARLLKLPVILVVGMRLGCLNHALLTQRAIAASGLKLAGWVANCVDGEMKMLNENIDALKLRLTAPLLGVVPHCQTPPDAKDIVQYLDFALLGR